MADFRVAHLPFGQTDIGPTGAEFTSRIVAIELVMKRRAGKKGGVTICLARFFAAGINAPAIANDEHHGARHGRTLPTIVKPDKEFPAGCGIDNRSRAQIHRADEVAQSTTRPFVSRRLWRAWCPLFSALGRSETVWNNSHYRRRACTGTGCIEPRFFGRL